MDRWALQRQQSPPAERPAARVAAGSLAQISTPPPLNKRAAAAKGSGQLHIAELQQPVQCIGDSGQRIGDGHVACAVVQQS